MRHSRFLHNKEEIRAFWWLLLGSLGFFVRGEEDLRAKARDAMRRATDFFSRGSCRRGELSPALFRRLDPTMGRNPSDSRMGSTPWHTCRRGHLSPRL